MPDPIPTGQPSGPTLLASLRQRARVTQSELAERAGVSRSMIAQVEMGERRPSRKLLERLGEAMQLPGEDLDHVLVAYGFAPTGDTLEQIAVFLRADRNLSTEQAERLADLVRRAYEQAMRERDGKRTKDG